MNFRIALAATVLACSFSLHAQDRVTVKERAVSFGNVSAACPPEYVAYGIECGGAGCERRDLACIEYPVTFEGEFIMEFDKQKQSEFEVEMFVTGIKENASSIGLRTFSGSSVRNSGDCRLAPPGRCQTGRYLAGLHCRGDGCSKPQLVCCLPTDNLETPTGKAGTNNVSK